MKPSSLIKTYLVETFSSTRVDSIVKYYSETIKKYQGGDWEGVSVKGAKFVEAVTKALMVFCSVSIPPARSFKAGNSLKSLEQLPASTFDAVVRIIIPKACLLIYEIANNRGGRHDTEDIDPNIMDAEIILPTMSWILAEMVRFSNQGKAPEQAKNLIQSLTKKTYPYFEEIDGRPYINIQNLDAQGTAILLLYKKYPGRISRKDLINFVERHGFRNNAASVAVHRIKSFVDDRGGDFKLRGLGRQKAEDLLSKK